TTSRTFTVATVANTLVDGNRSVPLRLSSPAGTSAMLGTTTSAGLTIVDDDRAGTFRLSAPSYTVSESARNAPITIQRLPGSGSAAGVVVSFVLTNGTALAGRDYTIPANQSVTFGAADSAKTVLVPIAGNTLVDGPRSFTFALTNVSSNGTLAAAQTSAPVTITDDDAGGTLQF